MSTESPQDDRAQPGASPSIFTDHEDKGASISDGTTGATTTPTTNTTTNTIHKHNTNTTLKQRVNVYLSALNWKVFKQQAYALGYSASELLDYFISSIVEGGKTIEHKVPAFNVAIAKAEAKPTINVGEYIAEKQLDIIIAKVHALKKKAEEQAGDTPLSFTVSRSKELEEDILRVLRGVKKISPAKLEEVNAALTILRSIRGGA